MTTSGAGLAVGATVTLSDSVYEAMTDLIADGTWSARTRLPSEIDLARQFGVSRPIVRQALARLRKTGLVVSRKGSGSFVQTPGPGAPVLPAFPGIESIAALERFLDFREGVEGEVAAIAARNRSESSLALLKDVAMRKPATAMDDFDFHMAVALCSENTFYSNTVASLRDHLLFCMNMTRSFAHRNNAHVEMVREQHGAIVQALIDQDEVEAREAMRRHLAWSRRRAFVGLPSA